VRLWSAEEASTQTDSPAVSRRRVGAHADDEERRRAERARRVALFRYELIQDVIDPALSSRQRGRLIRELAGRDHQGPFGEQVRVSRPTIDRWTRWWRAGGFEALVPTPRG
jgi:putative transposase